MKNYTISEKIALAIGILLAISQITRYSLGLIEENSIEKYAAIVWILLIIAPKKIVSLINKLTWK